MTTYRSEVISVPNGCAVNAQGAAEVEAARKRLGITKEELERRRDASVRSQF